MTLRELINSVDIEQYSDNTLFQKLREIKPEYGSNKHIAVKLMNGEVAVTNAHVGSLGDILAYPIDVDPDLQVTKVQLLDLILNEIASDGYTEGQEKGRSRKGQEDQPLPPAVQEEIADPRSAQSPRSRLR